ncbi:MAG: LLM class flavin-dependent oxidoreductase [bacterium]|nr:LLM class flavin-dependent oxidoreductase [bacterium]
MFRMWASRDMYAPLSEIADHVRRAEAMGFQGILAPDVMTDDFLAAHAATERVRVGTSALVCFPRSPMTTGVAAWNLQALSGGRFPLGLGPRSARTSSASTARPGPLRLRACASTFNRCTHSSSACRTGRRSTSRASTTGSRR